MKNYCCSLPLLAAVRRSGNSMHTIEDPKQKSAVMAKSKTHIYTQFSQKQWWSVARCKYLWQNPFHIFYRFQTIIRCCCCGCCSCLYLAWAIFADATAARSDAKTEFILFVSFCFARVCVQRVCLWNGSMCVADRVTWKRKMKAIVVYRIRLWWFWDEVLWLFRIGGTGPFPTNF